MTTCAITHSDPDKWIIEKRLSEHPDSPVAKWTIPRSEKCKKVTKQSRKSCLADRAIIDAVAANADPTLASSDGTLVTIHDVAKAYEKRSGDKDVLIMQPRPWRSIGDELKVVLLQFALQSLERASPRKQIYQINLHLDDVRRKLAMANHRGLTDYIKRRIDRNLKRALGFAPNYWLVMEITEEGLHHFHGAILATETELEMARPAIKAAGGRFDGGFSKKALRMGKVRDIHWATYCTKHLRYSGETPTCDNQTRRLAKNMYQDFLAIVRATRTHGG